MKSNETILKLINKKASVNEICSITGLSHKQLFYRMNMLKIKGYDFKKKYFYNGEIEYSLLKGFNKEIENEKTIITSPKDTEFKALLISDIHFGSIYARPELLFEVYNYAIKEGIHIIINTGDLVDGTFGNKKTITDVEKQIEHLLKCYPFDKNILNFICLGNHDYSCLEHNGIDLNKILENKRHDLVSLGYGQGFINVKNDFITVCHPQTESKEEKKVINRGLILTGHHHLGKFIANGSVVNLHLPTLSNINTSKVNNNLYYPSILKMTVGFLNGVFNNGLFENLIFIDNNLYKVFESQYTLHLGKDSSKNMVNNEEKRKSLSMGDLEKIVKKDDVKKLERKITSDMSQIEKFNARFGK